MKGQASNVVIETATSEPYLKHTKKKIVLNFKK